MRKHWDGVKEDGSFLSDDMNSFNHYVYGSVFAWIFETAGGIKIPDGGEGYKNVIIAPKPDMRLKFVDTSIQTRRGVIRSAWKYCDEFIRYEIETPERVDVIVTLPNGKEIKSNGGKVILYTEKI